jgi:glycerol-3-phosphate dehydrogenase
VRPLQHEIDYLLETYGAYFPRAVGATPRESFAGLRVLPRATSAVFHRPRDTLIVCDAEQQPKVVNVVGGKLTAYRATAAKVVDTFAASLPARAARGDTARLRLLAV